MIIDDSDSTRASLEIILKELGHQVLAAENGVEAIRHLEQDTPFDLILTDIFMPEMDGIEFIEKAKALYPELKIIAMSAGGMGLKGTEMLAIASDLGAERVVTKPFSSGDIQNAVSTALQG